METVFDIYDNISFGARLLNRPTIFEHEHSGTNLVFLILMIAVAFLLFLFVLFIWPRIFG